MICEYYSIETELIGLPSDKMIAGPPRIHEYAYCKLYKHRCHTCKGDVNKCYRDITIKNVKGVIK